MGLNILEMIRKYGRRVSLRDEQVIRSIILGDGGQTNNPNIGPRPPAPGESGVPLGFITDQTPSPVASVGNPGSDTTVLPSDHEHEGLHSISKLGSPLLTGDATFTGTGGVELTQSGQNIQVDGSNVSGTGTRIVEYFTMLVTSSIQVSLLFTPIEDPAVYLGGLRKVKTTHWTYSGNVVDFSPMMTAFVDSEIVIIEYWYTPGDS
tara:strand:- start:125 stop:742 length:618 start_codon:yes stop_codon:yes gene_type:complete